MRSFDHKKSLTTHGRFCDLQGFGKFLKKKYFLEVRYRPPQTYFQTQKVYVALKLGLTRLTCVYNVHLVTKHEAT